MRTSNNRAIIIGSVVGVTAFIALLISLFIFCKRRKIRKMSFFGRDEPKPRSMLFAGEDMDEPVQQYRDYPASLHSSSHANSPALGPMFDPMRMVNTPTPSIQSRNAPSPHLLGLRASESGSIFHEAVWPPPGEASRFVDPLTLASSSVNLGNIVDDVMGPSTSTVNVASASLIDAHQNPNVPYYRRSSTPQPGAAVRETSLSSEYSDLPAAHSRATSQTALLAGLGDSRPGSPGSPQSLRRLQPLFVTNQGPGSPTSPTSPPPHPLSQTPPTSSPSKNWLQRKLRDSLEMEASEESVGRAL